MSGATEVGRPTERTGAESRRSREWRDLVQIAEVTLLALVALATAWSGYQSSRWDGRQSLLYGEATRDRFQADAASTYGGQELAADASLFNGWLGARAAGQTALATSYVRRFTPDYRTAFVAWLATKPFSNPHAVPGPGYMPQYHNPYMEQAARLNAQADATFAAGTAANETSDKYVRDTVLFASALFLLAVAQRFELPAVRIGTVLMAAGLTVFVLVSVILLPRG